MFTKISLLGIGEKKKKNDQEEQKIFGANKNELTIKVEMYT